MLAIFFFWPLWTRSPAGSKWFIPTLSVWDPCGSSYQLHRRIMMEKMDRNPLAIFKERDYQTLPSKINIHKLQYWLKWHTVSTHTYSLNKAGCLCRCYVTAWGPNNNCSELNGKQSAWLCSLSVWQRGLFLLMVFSEEAFPFLAMVWPYTVPWRGPKHLKKKRGFKVADPGSHSLRVASLGAL